MQDSDEPLVARIAAGDRLAMQALFARRHVKLYRYALRLTREEKTAEEIVLEVFLDVWRHSGRFRPGSGVLVWLLAMVRAKAHAALSLRAPPPAAKSAKRSKAAPSEPEPPHDENALFSRCLDALDAEKREMIDLVYYHDLSVEDVSRIVGVSKNGVKAQMFQARKDLADLLRAAEAGRIAS